MLRRRALIGFCAVWWLSASLFWSFAPHAQAKNSQTERNTGSRIRPVRTSLEDAVRTALTRNPRIQSQLLSVQQREQERRAAYSDLFPQLTVQYGVAVDRYQNEGFIDALDQKHPSRWTQRSIKVGGFPEWRTPAYPYRIDPYRNFQLTATLTQPLYQGGRLTNAYKIADLAVAGSGLDLEILRQDLALQVIQAYYQVVLGKKLFRVAEESIRSLTAFRNRAQAFYRAGEGLQIDVKAAKAQLARAYAQREQAVTAIGTAMSVLNLLLDNPQTLEIAVDEDLRNDRPTYRIPEIYDTAVANRSEIRRADISVQQARAAVKIAKANLLPRIDLQLQGQRINDDWNVFDPEGTNDWTVQGTLTWAFDLFRKLSTVEGRQAATAQNVVEQRYLIQQILQQAHVAYLDVRRSQSDVKAYKEAVDARVDQFSMARELYDRQMTTYLHVLDAQDGLDQAKANLFSAMTSLILSTAQLERQMGILGNRFAGTAQRRP